MGSFGCLEDTPMTVWLMIMVRFSFFFDDEEPNIAKQQQKDFSTISGAIMLRQTGGLGFTDQPRSTTLVSKLK
jgi:hypothetical protein